MYENRWLVETPGCVIFLIDQSSSMALDKKANNAANAIQSSILDYLVWSIRGEDIRNKVYIAVIGYGGANGTKVIKQGWIGDWAMDLLVAKENDSCIIPAEADGLTSMTEMAEAFTLAKDILDAFVQDRVSNNFGIAAPLVFNITGGMSTELGKQTTAMNGETAEEAYQAAKALVNTKTSDGNVQLMNVYISNDKSEVACPSESLFVNGDEVSELLFDISSTLTRRTLVYAYSLWGKSEFNYLQDGSKGFVAYARNKTISRFIRLCCSPFMTCGTPSH